ncbi:MAG: hypothetical protein IKR21_05385 [Oscillospiraceae bacterium]|nr:hypothetical protein [Oscillospiraceae bacterium]
MLNSIIKLSKSAIKGKASLIIYLVCLALAVFTPLPAAVVVIAAGAAGVIIGRVSGRARQ